MKPRERVVRQMLQSAIELLNYALQIICPLIARHSAPGHDELHATFTVVQCFLVSEPTLLLWEDAGVH